MRNADFASSDLSEELLLLEVFYVSDVEHRCIGHLPLRLLLRCLFLRLTACVFCCRRCCLFASFLRNSLFYFFISFAVLNTVELLELRLQGLLTVLVNELLAIFGFRNGEEEVDI